MFDNRLQPLVFKVTHPIAEFLHNKGVRADQVTIGGFFLGLLACVAVTFGAFYWALFFLALNRLSDGVDGELARLTEPTDQGAFLDIVLDFLFYNAFAFAFILFDPSLNAVAGAVLMLSFMGTGASFLAFAALAAKRNLKNPKYPNKSLYYASGLTEGFETIFIFVLFCIFPQFFPVLALAFATLCFITTFTRVIGGYHSLR